MTEPMTDLGEMLRTLDVTVRPDPYVFVVVTPSSAGAADAAALVAEDEGLTAVLPVTRARELGLPEGPAFAWLTLTVHSSLEAVGLTAAFSTALAAAGISCNVLAGYHHDHLLVPLADRDRAVAVLRALG